MTNAQHAALWDVINEGGEGYRPDYAIRRATPVAARPAAQADRMLRDAKGAYVPAAKVAARLAANVAKLSRLTDATAIAIVSASIAADQALLA